MAVFSRVGAFLKNSWDKEPVIVVSISIGLLTLSLPFITPYKKYIPLYNKVVPYNYPVPVRDDGNMPDVPSHPSDKVGPNLDWLKNL